MKNPLKETLEQWRDHPELIIGMERQLIIDFIGEIKKYIENGNIKYDHQRELCDDIINQIRNKSHWSSFRFLSNLKT